jgi:acyl carrier protein
METKETKSSGNVESSAGAASNGVAQVKDGTSPASASADRAMMPRPPAYPKADDSRARDRAVHLANGAPKANTADVWGESTASGQDVTRDDSVAWPQSDASAWLSAYEAIQCRTAEAHAMYQQTMAQCHLAFLHAAEQSALALASVATGSPAPALATSHPVALPALPAARAPAPTRPRPSPEAPARRGAPPVAPPPARVIARSTPIPAPVVAEALKAPHDPAPASPQVLAPAPGSPPAAVKANGGLTLPADGDLKSFLLGIVSEKTGYPVEILNLDQQLEADLGIDSIKRVEILSAFEGHVPDIKDVNLEEVAKLATLRDVLGFMERYADKLGLEKKKE